jgi:CRP-like cAMP-binding protein
MKHATTSQTTLERAPITAVEALKAKKDVHEAASLLKATPRPPVLAREPVFFGAAYRQYVAERRNNIARAEMKRRLRLQRRDDAVDDISSSDGEELTGEALRDWQKQWLRIIQMVLFMTSRRLARKMNALETLRRLLLPMLVKRLSRQRLIQRMQKIKILLLAQMTPLCLDDLVHLDVFLGWDRDNVADALQQFSPLAFSADSVLVSEGEKDGSLFILDSGRVRVCKRRPPDRDIVMAALQGKRNLSEALRQCYDVISVGSSKGSCYNSLSVVQGTPAFVSLRSAEEGRTLVWHLEASTYNIIMQRHKHPDFAKARRSLIQDLRCRQMVSANPPTPQALRNCLRNAAFSCWPEKQLQLLIASLKPVALHPGELLLDSSDAVLGQRIAFIAGGVVDVTIKTGNDASAVLHTTLGPWTCFGADAIAVNERKHFHVTAKSEVDAYCCERDDIDLLHSKDPQLLMQSRRGICEQRERAMPHGQAICEQMPHVLEALRRDPALQLLPDNLIELLCASATPIWLPPNEPVLSPNLRASIVVIASGVCRGQRVSLNPSTANLDPDLNLRSGTVMGVMSVALDSTFPFSVTTRSVVEAYSISPSAFSSVLKPASLLKVQEYCSFSKMLQVITLPTGK